MTKQSFRKIITGGQTGVDQAALQFAIDVGIEHGGWCPPGRVCESGGIHERFKLKETPEDCDPSVPGVPRSQRTIWNVRDSDGLLVFIDGEGSKGLRDRGSELAIKTAGKLGKPFLVVAFDSTPIQEVRSWIWENNIAVLNIAGPIESNSRGIYQSVVRYLNHLFLVL